MRELIICHIRESCDFCSQWTTDSHGSNLNMNSLSICSLPDHTLNLSQLLRYLAIALYSSVFRCCSFYPRNCKLYILFTRVQCTFCIQDFFYFTLHYKIIWPILYITSEAGVGGRWMHFKRRKSSICLNYSSLFSRSFITLWTWG
jgi:hypothetical protein